MCNKSIKHGFYGTPTYKSWDSMKQRCTNPKAKGSKNYLSRGIKICEKWLDFKGFYEDMGTRPEGMSLDRIDGSKEYCKENCKWSTQEEQQNNKRNNLNITYDNKTQSLAKWSKELGFHDSTLRNRINSNNWSIEKAFTIKPS